MEKILKIRLDKFGVYQTNLDEIVINEDVLRNDQRQYEIIAEIFGRKTASMLNEIYGCPNGNQDYNLVLLTDEELNGLEGKTK